MFSFLLLSFLFKSRYFWMKFIDLFWIIFSWLSWSNRILLWSFRHWFKHSFKTNLTLLYLVSLAIKKRIKYISWISRNLTSWLFFKLISYRFTFLFDILWSSSTFYWFLVIINQIFDITMLRLSISIWNKYRNIWLYFWFFGFVAYCLVEDIYHDSKFVLVER